MSIVMYERTTKMPCHVYIDTIDHKRLKIGLIRYFSEDHDDPLFHMEIPSEADPDTMINWLYELLDQYRMKGSYDVFEVSFDHAKLMVMNLIIPLRIAYCGDEAKQRIFLKKMVEIM